MHYDLHKTIVICVLLKRIQTVTLQYTASSHLCQPQRASIHLGHLYCKLWYGKEHAGQTLRAVMRVNHASIIFQTHIHLLQKKEFMWLETFIMTLICILEEENKKEPHDWMSHTMAHCALIWPTTSNYADQDQTPCYKSIIVTKHSSTMCHCNHKHIIKN